MSAIKTFLRQIGPALVIVALAGCSSGGGQTGSETNWLPCNTTSDCNEHGVCTGGRCIPNTMEPTACSWSTVESSKDARDRIQQTRLLPSSARLELVRSDPAGAMRVDGRSTWHFIYWDASPQLLHDFSVCGAEVLHETRSSALDCDMNEVPALESTTVISDAASRIPGYAEHDLQDHFLIQEMPCMSSSLTEVDYVMILLADHTDAQRDRSEWWFVHYEGGTFQKTCGPCATNNVAECTTCGAS